jgi:hypothetical protein
MFTILFCIRFMSDRDRDTGCKSLPYGKNIVSFNS